MKSQIQKFDILIIGSGIMGSAIAYQLSQYNIRLAILEANSVIADETTAANSGLIHGGFDPVPEKIEAKLNHQGNILWTTKWFKNLYFPRIKIDSLVIAYDEREKSELNLLFKRGITNGLTNKEIKIISKKELFELEPNINKTAVGALYCKNSWMIDPVKASLSMIGAAINNGTNIFTNSKVVEIKKIDGYFNILTEDKQKFQAKVIINAAGHYADWIAEIAGYLDFKLKARRGEYRILDKTQKGIVKHVCFMVPTIHGKGVLVSPMINGNILIGPTAEEGIKKEDTRLTSKRMYDEIGKIAKKIVPTINIDRTIATFAGSRAIDIETDDFIIKPAKADKNFINCAGIQSPGISSAPAIVEMIVNYVKKSDLVLKKKNSYNLKYRID